MMQVGNATIGARRKIRPNKAHLVMGASHVKVQKGYSVDVTHNTPMNLMARSNNYQGNRKRRQKSKNVDPIKKLIQASAEKRLMKARAAKLWTLTKSMVRVNTVRMRACANIDRKPN